MSLMLISRSRGRHRKRTYAPIIFENFDYVSEIPDVFDNGDTTFKKLWYHVDSISGTPQSVGTVTLESGGPFGQHLKDAVQDSASAKPMHLNFYNNWGGPSNNWKYLREHAGYTELNKYNRLRFWMHIPSTVVKPGSGGTNMHFGTYQRLSTDPTTSNESNNWHFYHYFTVWPTGGWQQFIIDPHPNHQRGAAGATEHGTKAVLEAGYNYFDSMTWFYLEYAGVISGGGDFLFDRFELYQETYNEDIDHIYSLRGGLSQLVSNQIFVTWKRDKTEDAKTFDVKYSFTSFYANGGWSHGTNAPSGQGIAPLSVGGINGVEYITDQIDLTGQDVIYIAIKHEDEATRFRQIAIPLTSAGYQQV